MAGLSLGAGGFGSVGTPMQQASLPAAAQSPTGPVTIGTRAFGIGTSQTDVGPRTAGFGTVTLGIAGAVVLAWLWYSLPR